jgi:RNA polymerase sigma-70 factor (ECF subfamily)
LPPASWNQQVPDIAEAGRPAPAPLSAEDRRNQFNALYREHFDFVFRNLRRLGVAEASVDDALQDVFLVVLRRIDGFEAGTHAKAWLFAIAMRVAGNYRRAFGRRGVPIALAPDAVASAQLGPFDRLSRSEAARVLHAFLESLDPDKRAVFVMAELEQMTAPEIALATAANANTVYSRLRAARIAFERVLSALQNDREEHG